MLDVKFLRLLPRYSLTNQAALFGGLTQGMMVPLDGSARTQLLASRVFEKNVNIDIVPSATSSKLQQSQPPSGQPARPRASGAWTSVFSRYMNPVDVPDSMETRLQNVENSVNHIGMAIRLLRVCFLHRLIRIVQSQCFLSFSTRFRGQVVVMLQPNGFFLPSFKPARSSRTEHSRHTRLQLHCRLLDISART